MIESLFFCLRYYFPIIETPKRMQERERQREREKERKRDRERETERQRERDRVTERQGDRSHKNRKIEIQKERWTERER